MSTTATRVARCPHFVTDVNDRDLCSEESRNNSNSHNGAIPWIFMNSPRRPTSRRHPIC